MARAEQDQEKTAITTPFVPMYQWSCMPFGLCNTQTTFQALMEAVLGDLVCSFDAHYKDDVLVFSKGFDSYKENLDQVFGYLQELFLLKVKVKFLGHVVSAKGMQVDIEKVKVLESWAIPRSSKRLA